MNSDYENERSFGSFIEIMEVLLCVNPEMVSESFYFFKDLIDFAGIYNVDLMMKNLLSNNEELISLHLYLKDNGFVKNIVKKIKNYRESGISDTRLGYLFYYLTLCSKNDYLAEQCLLPSSLSVILDFKNDDTNEVISKQWELISELNLNNLDNLIEILENAIALIEYSNECFFSYDEHIINFISKTLKFNPKLFQRINVDFLCCCIKKKILKNQNNTIAFKTINNLVLIGIRCKETQSTFINSFINFYIKIFLKTDNRISHSFSYNLLLKVSETCEYDWQLNEILQKEEKYNKVIRNDIQNVSSIMHKSYGQCLDYDEPISSPIL